MTGWMMRERTVAREVRSREPGGGEKQLARTDMRSQSSLTKLTACFSAILRDAGGRWSVDSGGEKARPNNNLARLVACRVAARCGASDIRRARGRENVRSSACVEYAQRPRSFVRRAVWRARRRKASADALKKLRFL